MNHTKDSLFLISSKSEIEEMKKVINISLSNSRHNRSASSDSKDNLIPNQACQTTINLYINDPHITQKSWNKYRKTPTRRKTKNEIVLGKSIPDHTLMKNLLGDLDVKKYSSAPNMTTKRKILKTDIPTSEGSFTDSSDATFQEKIFHESCTVDPEKKATFLYINGRKSGGDYVSKKIDNIREEEKEPFSFRADSVVATKEDCTTGRTEKKILRDPLTRFKRKPFGDSLIAKDPPITSRPQDNVRIEQPRRTKPCFRARTRLVQNVLNGNPQLMHDYQTGLMRNHKKLFHSLRHKRFPDIAEELKSSEIGDNLNEKIENLDLKQSKLIFCGKNRRSICSMESHGPYEEYRRRLVKAADGTLCCRNLGNEDGDGDDEKTWSRAGTRNLITSEFVKDKVKKFDRLIAKMSKAKCRNVMCTNAKYCSQRLQLPYEETRGLDSIEEHVSFPRETKNAMTRLLSEKSRMYFHRGPMGGTVDEDCRNDKEIKDDVTTTIGFGGDTRANDTSKGCWPSGVAERRRSTAEENTACGVNCRRS